jgi:hypothetical protein
MRLERDSFSEEFWKKSDWFHKLFNEAVKKPKRKTDKKAFQMCIPIVENSFMNYQMAIL